MVQGPATLDWKVKAINQSIKTTLLSLYGAWKPFISVSLMKTVSVAERRSEDGDVVMKVTAAEDGENGCFSAHS